MSRGRGYLYERQGIWSLPLPFAASVRKGGRKEAHTALRKTLSPASFVLRVLLRAHSRFFCRWELQKQSDHPDPQGRKAQKHAPSACATVWRLFSHVFCGGVGLTGSASTGKSTSLFEQAVESSDFFDCL